MAINVEVDAEELFIALGKLGDIVSLACRDIAEAGAVVADRALDAYIPEGTPGNSTAPPGHLRSTVTIYGPYPTRGKASWTANVGPNTIYALQRNYGGEITAKNPSGRLWFWRFGVPLSPPTVNQVGSFYAQKAWLATRAPYRVKAMEIMVKVLAPFG